MAIIASNIKIEDCEDVEVLRIHIRNQEEKNKELKRLIDIDIKNLTNNNQDLVKQNESLQQTNKLNEKVIKNLLKQVKLKEY